MTTPSTTTEMSAAAVAEAAAQARAAADKLAHTTLAERLAAVKAISAYVLEHKEDIADAVCRETRKTRTDALVSEVMGVLDNFEWLLHRAPKILADQKVPTPIALLGKKSRI